MASIWIQFQPNCRLLLFVLCPWARCFTMQCTHSTALTSLIKRQQGCMLPKELKWQHEYDYLHYNVQFAPGG